MQSKAATVEQYLAELTPERREVLSVVRGVILENLDPLLEEGMQYGAIGYYVPHRHYPAGYHCDPKQPLPFAGLASQKDYMTLNLFCIYTHVGPGAPLIEWFQRAWVEAGKKLKMGKACVRFRKLEDVPLDVVAEAFRRVRVKDFIAMYESSVAMQLKK